MTPFWKTVLLILLILLIMPITLVAGLTVWYATLQVPHGKGDVVVNPPSPAMQQVFDAQAGKKLLGDDVRDSRLVELRSKAAMAEKNSIERAEVIRKRLLQSEGGDDAEVKKTLRSELRIVVLEAFKARQDLYSGELASLEIKSKAMKKRLSEREASLSEIVDQRVDELLNPAKQWTSIESAAHSPSLETTSAESTSAAEANSFSPLPASQRDADQAAEIIDVVVDRKNARSVVEAYVAAALAGRIAHAASLATDAPADPKQIETFPRQLNVQRLAMKSVYVNDPTKPTKALATSEGVKLSKKQPNGQGDGFLVLALTMSEQGWLVIDIDFETEESAEGELQRFLDANPNAIGVPPRMASGRKLGTILGKPILDSDLNKNTSTDDNLKRLLHQPLMEDYCRKHGLDRADELSAKIQDERNRRMARFFVLPAELNRHLFEKHGGRVLLSPFGAVAFDGMKKWLEEREQAGDFEITDPELKSKFRELWMQEPEGARFASPDQIKDAFDPAKTDRFIDNFLKKVEPTNRTSRTFPFEKINGHIASIKQRTITAEAAAELRMITGLNFGDGVDRESRQAWLKWWEHETSCIDSAKDGVREFIVTGMITANGKPVLGANVQAHVPFKSSPSGQYQLAQTHSDLSGRYVLVFGIPSFATPEESTWQSTFTVRNPPRFIADQLPVVMTLHRDNAKGADTNSILGTTTLEKSEAVLVGYPVEMNFKLLPASIRAAPDSDTP
ncbi:MAG: hypothetical protein ABL921_01075 [Pirellula sp.]